MFQEYFLLDLKLHRSLFLYERWIKWLSAMWNSDEHTESYCAVIFTCPQVAKTYNINAAALSIDMFLYDFVLVMLSKCLNVLSKNPNFLFLDIHNIFNKWKKFISFFYKIHSVSSLITTYVRNELRSCFLQILFGETWDEQHLCNVIYLLCQPARDMPSPSIKVKA